VYKFTTKKGSEELILSPKNKKIVKLFKNLFVSSLVFIWTFLIIFFFHYNKKPFFGPPKGFNGQIEKFIGPPKGFNGQIEKFIGPNKKPFIDLNNFDFYNPSLIIPMFEIFKTILLAYPLCVSIYLIVSTNKLAMLTRSLL
jgi:hypothetical protein